MWILSQLFSTIEKLFMKQRLKDQRQRYKHRSRMSESCDIRLEGVTLLLLRWKGPQANKWRLPLGAGIGKETVSPGDGRAISIVKAQITILGMFNRKTCTLKHICLGETSTFLCDKILTLDLPFFHKHYKAGGGGKNL